MPTLIELRSSGRYGYAYGRHVDKKRTEILMSPRGTEN
jgi:ribosomal protein L37AE/L43A